MANSGTLAEWGQVLAGSWKIQGVDPKDTGSLNVDWLPGSDSLHAICVQPALTGSWTASADSSTGEIRHHTINADGSSDVTHITKVGPNQWSMHQVCVLPNGEEASNTSSFIVTDNGNTLIQKVTNRVVGGLPLPDTRYVLTRK